MTQDYAGLLDSLTRLRGVHGAMVVSRSDGVVVAEALMEHVKSRALAALAAALAQRVTDLCDAVGRGAPRFLQLQATEGSLFLAPAGGAAGDELLVVMIAGVDTPVGLARLEVLQAAEQLA